MSAANDTMTVEQAYRTMLAFLEREVDLTESSDLADLVSEYKLGVDGHTRDPAIWEAWLDAAAKARGPGKPA